MNKLFFVFWILLSVFVDDLHSYAESCYYCSGTTKCTDPMDYREVATRKCLEEESYCIKIILSTKASSGQLIGHNLAYRRCFHPSYEDEEEHICQDVKKSEKNALAYFNYTLASFQCFTCDKTDCNSAIIKNGWSMWITILIVIVYCTFYLEKVLIGLINSV